MSVAFQRMPCFWEQVPSACLFGRWGDRYRHKDVNDAEFGMRIPTVMQHSALSQGLNSDCLPHKCSVCYKYSDVRESGQGYKVPGAFAPVRCSEGLLKTAFAE